MNTCRVDGCSRRVLAKNLCPAHYQRMRTGRPLDAPMRASAGTMPAWCSVYDCNRPCHARDIVRFTACGRGLVGMLKLH